MINSIDHLVIVLASGKQIYTTVSYISKAFYTLILIDKTVANT